MTEDTFCTYCLVIASKYSERGRAALAKDENAFLRNDHSLKKMIEKFKRELKDDGSP